MNEHLKSLLSEAHGAFLIGDYERVLNKCRLAFTLNPGAVGAYEMAGKACFVMKRVEEAEKYFRKAISLDEQNGEHYFSLGNCLAAQNRLQEALCCYADAENRSCRDKVKQKLYYTMGKINQRMAKGSNDYEQLKYALANYEKSLKVSENNPDLKDILLSQVEIYVAMRNWESAENTATQLKLLMPGQFKNYQLLFQIMLQQKKLDRAASILEEAERDCENTDTNRIEIIFDYAMIHCFLADMYPDEMEKHFKNASLQLDKLKLISNLPEDVELEADLTRADMQLKMGNREKAMTYAEKIAEMDNEAHTEYIEKARFIMVDCCRHFSDNKEAVRRYAKLLKGSKNPLYCYHGYYSEYWAVKELSRTDESLMGDANALYDRAIAYYKQASLQNPADFLAQVFRAQVYAEAGKFEQAEKICDLLPAGAKEQLSEHIARCREEQNRGE